MADPWELILHHSYTGTPGFAFDLSPGRGSHGTAIGLHDSDFRADGATTGSGAVSFESGAGRIFVPHSSHWSPLQGFRVEMLFYRNAVSLSFDTLLDSAPFTVQIRGDLTNAVVNTGTTHHILRYHHTTAQQWMTLGLTCDGVSTIELSVDGTVVDRVFQPLEDLDPMTGLLIGGEDGPLFLNGRIDDVKVWRLNPDRVPNEFGSRPMTPPVIDCWNRWGTEFVQALQDLDAENPECLAFILSRLRRAIYSGLGQTVTHSPDTHGRLTSATTAYREAWFAGNLGDIRAIIVDLLDGLEREGLDVTQNADFQYLVGSDCWRRLMELVTPLDCDPAFTGIWR